MSRIVRHIYLFIFLIVSLFLATTSLAQSPNNYTVDVQHFTVEEGLSHRNATAAFQDSYDYIWIGTNYGLNRFDGHNFQVFTKEKDGLADNFIQQIVEDDEQWLWAINSTSFKVNNITFVNAYTLEVLTFEERFGSTDLLEEEIYSITTNHDKAIYISQKDMLWKYQHGQWSSRNIEGIGKYHQLHKNSEGEWLLKQILEDGVQLVLLKKDGQQEVLKTLKDRYRTLCFEDQQGAIWLKDASSLYRKLNNEKEFQLFDISEQLSIPKAEKTSFRLAVGNQQLLWFDNEKEFLVFAPDDAVVYDFNEEYAQIIESQINDFFHDRKGNTWVTTNFGVYKIRLTTSRFRNYLSLPIEQYGVNEAKSIRGIHLNGQKLWVNTTSDKDFVVNTPSNTARLIPKNDDHIFRPVLHLKENEYITASEELVYYKNYQPIRNYTWKRNAAVNFAWSLHQDAQENIWIGTHDKGLAFIQADSLAYYEQYNDFSTLSKSSIYHFL
ncbi:MAG: two-component regulator propeller domain-containing protein, partial [Bacteroidota bacterium]